MLPDAVVGLGCLWTTEKWFWACMC